MSKLLIKLEVFIERCSKVISYFIFIVIVIMVYEVSMRYLFHHATIWVHEVTQQLFGAASVLMGAYCLQKGKHIKVDFIYNLFPPRVRSAFDSFTLLIIIGWAFYYVYLGFPFAYESISTSEVSFTPLEAPLWPIKLSIPVAGLMLIIQALVKWIRSVYFTFTGKEIV